MVELLNGGPERRDKGTNKNTLLQISKAMEKTTEKYPAVFNTNWITLAVEILFISSMVILVLILRGL